MRLLEKGYTQIKLQSLNLQESEYKNKNVNYYLNTCEIYHIVIALN